MNCKAPGCTETATTRDFCGPDYRYRLHTGRFGYRDGGPARAHIAALRSLGWTWEQIAQAAGLSTWVAHNLHRGTSRRLLAESEEALLSVPLVSAESHRGVDAAGTRRRVQALAWMGWPTSEVAIRAGTTRATLATEISRGRVSVRLSHRVSTVYADLSGRRGPSAVAAGKARQLGFAPPAAWDDGRIDDPRARPAGIRREAS